MSIFFGESVENIYFYLFVFMFGYITHSLLSYILKLGNGMLMTKQAVNDSLTIIIHMNKRITEFNEFKYFSMRKMGKEPDEIEFQKKYDDVEMKSMRETMVRNLITRIPRRYSSIFEFRDWNSALNYYNTENK